MKVKQQTHGLKVQCFSIAISHNTPKLSIMFPYLIYTVLVYEVWRQFTITVITAIIVVLVSI